ncbi:MAG: hypothetical protein Q8918_12790 [Bacteroidota bacterium]|nr:hypothetical protein [Bacteroidota bacterium]
MPDNHFEHKAKNKLDELKFIPSEAVWLNVQAQIKKDKDRRRLLLWLPAACLLLGAGTWYLFHGKSKIYPVHVISTLSENGKNKINPSSETVESEKNRAIAVIPTDHSASNVQQQINHPRYEPKNKRSPLKENRQEPESRKPSGANESSMILGIEGRDQKKDVRKAEPQTNAPVIIQDSKKSRDAGINPAPDSGSVARANRKISSKADSTARGIAKTGGDDNLKNSPRKKTRTSNQDNIQWGITGGAGLSSHFNRFRNNNPYYTSNYGVPGNDHSFPPEKQSISFYIGLQAQKMLNNTTKIFAGLQYSYSEVRIAPGNLVNMPAAVYAGNYSLTNINSYYLVSGTNNYNYTNQYHFVEIPLGIEKQLGGKSRFSVNAGISLAWLVAVHALQYDPQTRIYFKENSYFNKAQWNVLGGIEYRLLQKEKYTLKIGPQFQYGLSGLLNRKSSYTEHAFFGGFQVLLMRTRK